MPIKNFSDLRSKLPFQYAKLIAPKLDGISTLQVRMVFNGEITDPEKVGKVLEEAKKLAVLFEQQKKLLGNKKRSFKSKSVKSTV